MPILDITTKPIVASNVTTTHDYATKEELKTSTIFNKDQDITDIIQYIGGSKWSVDYFVQIRDINDVAVLPDVNIPNTTLKYNRINKLTLNVQSEISQTDPNNITGEAVINSGFVPNYGDAFTATLFGGREAVFVITSVTKQTYGIHDIFDVGFKLFVFLDVDTVIYNDLVYKTIQEFVYDKDYLLDYSAPIILQKDYVAKIALRKQPKLILDFYMDLVFNTEANVIALPTVTSIYLDVFLTEFIFKIVNSDEHEDLLNVNRIENPSDDVKRSIWDVLIHRDIDMLSYVDKDIGFRYRPQTSANPNMRHLSYLNISFVATKLNGATVSDPAVNINNITTTSYTNPIGADKTAYVFSDSFYNNTPTTAGLLEQGLLQYLKGEVIDNKILDTLLLEYKYWTYSEQFYLLPVLIMLVKDSVRFSYKPI